MLTLKIVSPEGIVFNGEIESITVPGTLGRFQVLNNHAPIISSLESGLVEYKTIQGESERKDIKGGFVEVQQNEVRLCVEL